MVSPLGHCDDVECSQSSLTTGALVRLFRCSIHCDRLLCLHHLNAHNILYEEEKKQNDVVLNELQNHLTRYQTIFEQHLLEYRQIVHQASTLLLRNTSTIVPIEQIRPVLEKIQGTIAIFQQEKIIIKNESIVESTEFNVDSTFLKEISLIKTELTTPIKNHLTSNRAIVQVERIDYQSIHRNIDSTNDLNIEDHRSTKATDKNHPERPQRFRICSPIFYGKEKAKKKTKSKKNYDKSTTFKRLQR